MTKHPSSDEASGAAAPFRLTRFFSLACLVGIATVTAALFWTYHELSLRQLLAHETRTNADLTRAFANTVWEDHRGFVLRSAGRSREALLADPSQPRLRADVLQKMKGLQVAKVKIYNLDGTTAFSTDAKQIGEDKRANPGFIAARAGTVQSQITWRERFDAFEGVITDRSLISSYIPVRGRDDGPVEAVFEVYSDVTPLMQARARAQWQVAGVLFGMLALLYLFLLGVVRKADAIIAAQEQERAAKEATIRHQAYHDALTGLPNRSSFGEQLGATIAHAARHRRSCALMFIDLDRFKHVNDTLGHQAGDELLRQVAARLQGCLRESDRLFRMGGDEFTVILAEVAGGDECERVAGRIADAVSRPLAVQGAELQVGASIGVAVFPADARDPESLLRTADAQMYAAKERARRPRHPVSA